jgi:RNA polymerase sigma factor, sigma-70 family
MEVDVNWSNERLLTQLREGSPTAFEQIVHQYADNLLQRAFQWTKDENQAADLVQDVLLDLWESHPTLQVTHSLEGYLYRMLKHRFLRLVSRNKLHETAMTHLMQRMDEMQATVLDSIAASDLQQTLAEVVGKLPENMRKIFVLRNEDYSLREIAQALGLAEQTVKSYHSELNKRIREGILARHPDISHSLVALLIIQLM